MPVTCKPAPHGARPWNPHMQSSENAEELLRGAAHKEYSLMKTIIASSFPRLGAESGLSASENGFVRGCLQAYNEHHHLLIRPEDVWFAILTQFSLYVNANSELLRDKFVTHEGQKELSAWMVGTLKTADYAGFFYLMGKEIDKNVVDPDLRQWIMPAFTTTTKADEAIASAIFMGTMQKYFSYRMSLLCGLPSVTLLGDRSDWETILIRLDKLLSFGKEPTKWHSLLKPVLTNFINTFDSPDSKKIKDFWQNIAHHSGGGSGPRYLTGWITAFCFWDNDGKSLHIPGSNPPYVAMTQLLRGRTPVFTLSGVNYHRVDTNDIPTAYVGVPMKISEQDGTEHDARIVAGLLAMAVSSSGLPIELEKAPSNQYNPAPKLNADGTAFDTVQPQAGWLVYLTKSEEELKEQENDPHHMF